MYVHTRAGGRTYMVTLGSEDGANSSSSSMKAENQSHISLGSLP